MRILVDKNNPYVREAFSDFGEVELLKTSEFTRERVKQADALVVRSETRTGRELLEGSRVRFVGSATIGTDHVDLEFLRSSGIGFASAPGCNANSVAEYVVAALLRYAQQAEVSLSTLTVGVVGVGNVGSKVVERARAFGMTVLENDPPRQRRTGEQHFVSLEKIMEADLVTLHVPLTSKGEDATYHLFDRDRIARMKPGAVLMNTARGAVVETHVLKEALVSGRLRAALLDVWEHEPTIDTGLLEMATLATPHIAGYSFDGKLTAVRMIHQAMSEYFQMPRRWVVPNDLPKPNAREISLAPEDVRDPLGAVSGVVRRCYNIEADDASLREGLALDEASRGAHFRRLRAEYPVRREFGATRIRVPEDAGSLGSLLRAIGFSVEGQPQR